MKVLGVVEWKTIDKIGHPIAGVKPLFEILKAEWRAINAAEEFPTRGQAFWPNATAVERTLVYFRAEANPGQKDEYRVVDAEPAIEIVDLRSIGDATEVRSALMEGLAQNGIPPGRVLVWCKPEQLIGPIELSRSSNGFVKLSGTNLSKIQTFTGVEGDGIRRFHDGSRDRLIRVDKCAPSGYVDWDDDAAVLKRALHAATRLSKSAGKDTGQTKKQIDEAVELLVSQGTGPDAQLDLYRLQRAKALCNNSGLLSADAPALVEAIRQHPVIADKFAVLEKEIRKTVEQSVRAEVEKTLVNEQAALKQISVEAENKKQEVEQGQRTLEELATRAELLKKNADTVAKNVEDAINERVRAAIERPASLLAEVGILRPLIGKASRREESAGAANDETQQHSVLGWTCTRREAVKDRTAFKKALTAAARARGIAPSIMLQLHAAVSAQLVPVVLGPKSLSCLAAYAHAVCGNRLAVLHASPALVQPDDLIGRSQYGDSKPRPNGFLNVISEAATIDGVSILVLEGANRAPLESYLIPLLELREAKLSIRSADLTKDLHLPNGLRLAATVVAGATTVPVSPQLWRHAVALCADAEAVTPSTESYDLPLSSEFFVPGDVPEELIGEILDAWPESAELKIALERYGAACSRFYSEEARIRDALLDGLVFPYIATALDDDEQEDAVSKLGFASDSVPASTLASFRRRLR